MTGQGHRYFESIAMILEDQVGQGAHPLLLEERLVDPGEHGGRRGVEGDSGSERVAGQSDRRRRLYTLAGDVSQKYGGTPVGHGKHVVEVTTDLADKGDRPVAGRKIEAGHFGKGIWRDDGLEGLGYLPLLLIEARIF